MTKDAAGHGHWDGRGIFFREQAMAHGGDDVREFCRSAGEDLSSERILAAGDGGKERGEVGGRN